MQTLEVKTGYIYFIKSNLLGGYKIGITTSPVSRFKALAVGTKAKLIGYWKLDAYRELEKQLHKEYAAVRIPQSEWFDLDCTQIQEVIQKIASISDCEFLLPEFAQSFTGPQYRIIKTEPYNAEIYAGFNYFGALVICTLTAMLIGLNL
jgi:hypothetical protein